MLFIKNTFIVFRTDFDVVNLFVINFIIKILNLNRLFSEFEERVESLLTS